MQQVDQKTIIGARNSDRSFLQEGDKILESFMPRIAVMGIGGGGGNAIDLLKTKLDGQVDLFVCNTDVQVLYKSKCDNRIVLGSKTTKGKGAGAKPSIGRAAAEESIDEIVDILKQKNIDMLIIAGGEGGGTGTGAMPVIARAAREEGILTIAVVTKPFLFEGSHRMAIAEQGIRELQEEVDTLIVSANDNLRSVTNGTVSFKKAFEISDTFLSDCVMSFISIIQETGLVNVDFADLCSVAKDRKSRAIMGTGYAEGENCGSRAVEEAMSSLLLDFGDVKWDSVCNVVVCIHGGEDLGMNDVTDINEIVKNRISPNANIIMGATIRQEMKNSVRVFVFGTTNNKSQSKEEGRSDTKAGRKKSRIDENNSKIAFEYSDGEYIGTRHELHEDVSSYQIPNPVQSRPKPKPKSFLSKILGGWLNKNNNDEDDVSVVKSDFIPPFLRSKNQKHDDDDDE